MQALCNTLGDHGYETQGFTDGVTALEALEKARFDLLLADLMMPGMDGIALLQAARQLDQDLVGIIMTGEGTITSAVAAMKTGALDYILKPFKLSVILPVLSRALAVRDLRIANAELQRSILERTAELEAANKELEAFAYSVSHDLRSPLLVIAGSAEMLIDDHAGHMPANAQDLVHIGDLPDCTGDPALLKQVFTNLLSNAFKFTRGKEKPVIEVICRHQAGENTYSVRDNGAGFDMQQAKELFGAFQRFHSAQQFEGTGVGLSIVHRIVQRHGGRVWAEAELDKGASFHFSLPG